MSASKRETTTISLWERQADKAARRQIQIAHATPVQTAARELYDLECNVLPQLLKQKGGLPWQGLRAVRLPDHLLELCFTAPAVNIALMFGRTSRNLIGVDCETAEAYERTWREFERRGLPIWAYRSGGTKGGGTFLVRILDGTCANIPLGELADDIEIRASGVYSLVPPSLHPDTGAPYWWERRDGADIPVAELRDLDWLPLKLEHSARREQTAPANRLSGQYGAVSSATDEFLRGEVTQGERNRRLFAAVYNMLCCGLGEDETRERAREGAALCGLDQDKPRGQVGRTITSAVKRWRKDGSPHNTAPTGDEPRIWQLATAWVESQPWPGRTGSTDRAVALACCERARSDERDGVFRASIREIAELARINKETAQAALARLRAAGVLVFVPFDYDVTAGNRYRFGVSLHPYSSITTGSNSVRTSVLFHDASERGALGKTAARVLDGMRQLSRPAMPRELSEVTKLTTRQVRYGLDRLSSYKLAERIDGGWVCPDDIDLDLQVALPAKTSGAAKKRHERHMNERAQRAAELILKARKIIGTETIRAADNSLPRAA
jgi:hypothetical protein